MDQQNVILLAALAFGVMGLYYYNQRQCREGFDTIPAPLDRTLKIPQSVRFADQVEEIRAPSVPEVDQDAQRRDDLMFPSVPELMAEDDDDTLIEGYHVSLNTRNGSGRNPSLQIRGDPYIPKQDVLWGGSSIEQDLFRGTL